MEGQIECFARFSALLSVVVTTLVAQTSPSLQVDYGQVIAALLFDLVGVQRTAANGSLVNDVLSFPSHNFRFLGQWTAVHQSFIRSDCRTLRCSDETMDPPVHGRSAIRAPARLGTGVMSVCFDSLGYSNGTLGSSVDCTRRRVRHIHILRCVFHHQLPAHYIPLVPMQDAAIPVHLPSLYLHRLLHYSYPSDVRIIASHGKNSHSCTSRG
ncbi:hypothetical protein EDD85DRAFT_105807 [Armillaria nabsnona]|nr:hypothetical protein EDD85DRAFT_105807 [Armillaria nabsnona]